MPKGIYKRTEYHNNISRELLIKLRLKMGNKTGMFGKKHTEEAIKNISKGRKDKMVGKDHWEWKGKDVGYRALHSWVIRNLGKAKKCQYCGKEKTTPKSIHWANKSHNYKRVLTDWISLCAKCHGEYDAEHRRNKS